MKENNKIIKEKKTMKQEQSKLSIFIQFVMAILLVILSIMSLFIQELLLVVGILIVAFLWLGAYNNYRLSKKMGFVILYIFGGFLVLYNIIMALM